MEMKIQCKPQRQYQHTAGLSKDVKWTRRTVRLERNRTQCEEKDQFELNSFKLIISKIKAPGGTKTTRLKLVFRADVSRDEGVRAAARCVMSEKALTCARLMQCCDGDVVMVCAPRTVPRARRTGNVRH